MKPRTPCAFSFLTRDLHLQQGEDFHQKYGNPAEGVRDHYEEKPVGHGHVFVQSAPQVCGIDPGLIDGVEHAGVGEDDDEESHHVQTWRNAHAIHTHTYSGGNSIQILCFNYNTNTLMEESFKLFLHQTIISKMCFELSKVIIYLSTLIHPFIVVAC